MVDKLKRSGGFVWIIIQLQRRLDRAEVTSAWVYQYPASNVSRGG